LGKRAGYSCDGALSEIDKDVADIKIDVRGLRDGIDRLDAKFEAKLGGLDSKFERKLDEGFAKVDARFDKMDERFVRIDERFSKVETSIASALVKAMLLYAALAAAMLGTMARGFQWI
jgi:hypothetical protein